MKPEILIRPGVRVLRYQLPVNRHATRRPSLWARFWAAVCR